jgi:hypothetical protein
MDMADINAGDGDVWDEERDAASTGEVKEDTAGGQSQADLDLAAGSTSESQADLDLAAEQYGEFGDQPSQADLDLAAEQYGGFGDQPSQADLDLAAGSTSEFGDQPSQADLDLAAEQYGEFGDQTSQADLDLAAGSTSEFGDQSQTDFGEDGPLDFGSALSNMYSSEDTGAVDTFSGQSDFETAISAALDTATQQGGDAVAEGVAEDEHGQMGSAVDDHADDHDVDPTAGIG